MPGDLSETQINNVLSSQALGGWLVQMVNNLTSYR
jgi:hypothetical protein